MSKLSDKPWWTRTNFGLFSVKSAWNLIRKREEETKFYKKIWVWKKKISVATLMAQWYPKISHLCGCYVIPVDETVDHLFVKREVADFVCLHFSGAAGLSGP
ncbi:hypothetical protein H5410_037218 [Solanum commersonii]|uniref:Uncharacterized protein n=1 Tax=Solanum commersonii TaxID=4109 RepID=A0A9J5Y7E3_SOLCO|nr:hypothetical protein H5410_037218 [Solanum commersonii]